MEEWTAIGVSCLSLLVAGSTAWMSLIKHGSIKMTQPTVVFFGPDGGSIDVEQPRFKIYLRTLLYSTSQRGQTIESMHVSIQRAESKQNYSVWVYGEEKLVRGSGLNVPLQGVAYNHHFLMPPDGSTFRFLSGRYDLQVFAKRVTDKTPLELGRLVLHISESQAKELQRSDAGIYFDWGPDQNAYHAHVEFKKPTKPPNWLMEAAN